MRKKTVFTKTVGSRTYIFAVIENVIHGLLTGPSQPKKRGEYNNEESPVDEEPNTEARKALIIFLFVVTFSCVGVAGCLYYYAHSTGYLP